MCKFIGQLVKCFNIHQMICIVLHIIKSFWVSNFNEHSEHLAENIFFDVKLALTNKICVRTLKINVDSNPLNL